MMITMNRQDKVTLVEVTGTLEAADWQVVVEEVLHLVEPWGSDSLVLDLGSMTGSGVSAMRFLIGVLKVAKGRGQMMAVAGASPELRSLLRVTGALELITGFSSAEEAVAYCRRLSAGYAESVPA